MSVLLYGSECRLRLLLIIALDNESISHLRRAVKGIHKISSNNFKFYSLER